MGGSTTHTVNTLKGVLLPEILFICTANQFRSPIAAACFSRRLKLKGMDDKWTVASAGTWAHAGLPAHPKAIEAAASLGLDLKGHRTQEVDAALLDAADLIVVMQESHKEALEAEFPLVCGRVVLLGGLADIPNGEISDPARDNFARPEEAARLINTCVAKAFAMLVQFANLNQNNRESKSP